MLPVLSQHFILHTGASKHVSNWILSLYSQSYSQNIPGFLRILIQIFKWDLPTMMKFTREGMKHPTKVINIEIIQLIPLLYGELSRY